MTGNKEIYEMPELIVFNIIPDKPIFGDSVSVEPWHPSDEYYGDAE